MLHITTVGKLKSKIKINGNYQRTEKKVANAGKNIINHGPASDVVELKNPTNQNRTIHFEKTIILPGLTENAANLKVFMKEGFYNSFMDKCLKIPPDANSKTIKKYKNGLCLIRDIAKENINIYVFDEKIGKLTNKLLKSKDTQQQNLGQAFKYELTKKRVKEPEIVEYKNGFNFLENMTKNNGTTNQFREGISNFATILLRKPDSQNYELGKTIYEELIKTQHADVRMLSRLHAIQNEFLEANENKKSYETLKLTKKCVDSVINNFTNVEKNAKARSVIIKPLKAYEQEKAYICSLLAKTVAHGKQNDAIKYILEAISVYKKLGMKTQELFATNQIKRLKNSKMPNPLQEYSSKEIGDYLHGKLGRERQTKPSKISNKMKEYQKLCSNLSKDKKTPLPKMPGNMAYGNHKHIDDKYDVKLQFRKFKDKCLNLPENISPEDLSTLTKEFKALKIASEETGHLDKFCKKSIEFSSELINSENKVQQNLGLTLNNILPKTYFLKNHPKEL